MWKVGGAEKKAMPEQELSVTSSDKKVLCLS
jgi:hypothetical protein